MGLAQEIDWGLCNYLAKLWHKNRVKYSRYHQFKVIHVSDAIGCPIQVLLSRLYDVTPPCRSLFFMREGLEWEEKAREAIRQAEEGKGEFNTPYVTTYRYQDIVYAVVGTPDYTNLEKKELIEIKWTRFSPRSIEKILAFKGDKGVQIWPGPPPSGRPLFHYPDMCFRYRIWPSWIEQIAGYIWIFRRIGVEIEPTDTYIYAQRGTRIDLIRLEHWDPAISEWLRDFERDLKWVAKVFYDYKDWMFAPFHRLENIAWDELRDVFCTIWRWPRHYSRIEYRCRLCPFKWIGACPGLIPLRDWWWWSDDEIYTLKVWASISPEVQMVLDRWNMLDRIKNATWEDFKEIKRDLHINNRDVLELIRAAKADACKRSFRRKPIGGEEEILYVP